MDLLDTAPRWRAVHDKAIWRRVLGGGLQLVRDTGKLIGLLLVRRPDVLHLATSGHLAVVRDLVIAGMARLFRVPVVYHLHFGRLPEIADSATWEWRLLRIAMTMAATVVPIDRDTEEVIRQRMPEVQMVRLSNCIDPSALPQPRASRAKQRTAMYLGWIIPTKGMDELAEAWARLEAKDWRLRLVGPGDRVYQLYLMQRHGQRGIEFTGELSHGEAMQELADADVFVLPSHTEAFPNVVLEAMALGKPVVATSVGAIPEMLSEGCGVLVPPKRVQELAAALDEVMANAALRDDLGGRARARALTEYAIDGVFERLMALWKRAARRGALGPSSRRSPA